MLILKNPNPAPPPIEPDETIAAIGLLGISRTRAMRSQAFEDFIRDCFEVEPSIAFILEMFPA